jgi:hypothetical protein
LVIISVFFWLVSVSHPPLLFDDGEEVAAVGGKAQEAVGDGKSLTRRREGTKEGGGGFTRRRGGAEIF